MTRAADGTAWTFLTGHGHVLVAIAKNPQARIRDLAAEAGLTERTTQAIITDLEAAGYITRRRVGRRSHYTVHPARPFRHPSQAGLPIGPLLTLLAGPPPPAATPRADPAPAPVPAPVLAPSADVA